MEVNNIENFDRKENYIQILHIDDEESFLELTKIYLEKLSKKQLKVDTLSNPELFFLKINDSKYDLILCDYEMPFKDGLTLFQEIRDQNIDIPFVLFTGRAREEVIVNALNLGVNYFITKNSDTKSMFVELFHAITTLIQNWQFKSLLMISKENFESQIHEEFLIDLRNQAEPLLKISEENKTYSQSTTLVTLQKLIYEFDVHQLELKIQNEELQGTQQQLSKLQDYYKELFDNSLGNYISIDNKGVIIEANYTAQKFLSIEKENLINSVFTKFIDSQNQDKFYFYKRDLFLTKTRHEIEIKMIKANGEPIFVLLDGIFIPGQGGKIDQFRMNLIDITKRIKTERGLELKSNKLLIWIKIEKILQVNRTLSDIFSEIVELLQTMVKESANFGVFLSYYDKFWNSKNFDAKNCTNNILMAKIKVFSEIKGEIKLSVDEENLNNSQINELLMIEEISYLDIISERLGKFLEHYTIVNT